jgi:hypothetical protein
MTETKTFTITTSPAIMRRIERFLALLHFASNWGHSGIFGMPLDGDGSEKVKVDPIDRRLAHEVDAIGGVGYDIEIARDDSYSGYAINRERRSRFWTGPAANLYLDGEVRKTIPSRDHAYFERQEAANTESSAPRATE